MSSYDDEGKKLSPRGFRGLPLIPILALDLKGPLEGKIVLVLKVQFWVKGHLV